MEIRDHFGQQGKLDIGYEENEMLVHGTRDYGQCLECELFNQCHKLTIAETLDDVHRILHEKVWLNYGSIY